MLLRVLRSLVQSQPRPEQGSAGKRVLAPDSPVGQIFQLERASAAADVDRHRRMLYEGVRAGDSELLALVDEALATSRTTTPARKALHRPLALFFLGRYFTHALALEGRYAECGVFTGVSALFLCLTAKALRRGYTGTGLHLIDSFEGLAEPSAEDAIESPVPPPGKGAYAASLEYVRKTLHGFSDVSFHPGWIPQAFASLPEASWSFVHLDVDHYEPTYAGLEYFYPRLCAGGVVVCDDYGAPLHPGAHRAWNRYCNEHGIPFVVLDTGQAVILKA